MKVIFLDIDGVLNYADCKKRAYGFYFVDDEKIKLLKELVDKTGAKIVLSSTWRLERFPDCRDTAPRSYKLYHKLVRKLKEYDLQIFSHTPILPKRYRGREIEQWINDWQGELIESFIILDDNDDMNPYMDRLVQTSWFTGLTQEDVDEAVQKLNINKNRGKNND